MGGEGHPPLLECVLLLCNLVPREAMVPLCRGRCPVCDQTNVIIINKLSELSRISVQSVSQEGQVDLAVNKQACVLILYLGGQDAIR